MNTYAREDQELPDENTIEEPQQYNGKEPQVDSHDPDAEWGTDDD